MQLPNFLRSFLRYLFHNCPRRTHWGTDNCNRPLPSLCRSLHSHKRCWCMHPLIQKNARNYKHNFMIDCKTVGFFSKSAKKSVKRGVCVLRARSSRASHARTRGVFLASLPSLTLCFQPRSRPFVWLCSRVLEYAKIRTVLHSNFMMAN